MAYGEMRVCPNPDCNEIRTEDDRMQVDPGICPRCGRDTRKLTQGEGEPWQT
jgi:hypothetical protein